VLAVWDPGTLFGFVGVLFLFISPLVVWFLLRKTKGESVWRSAAEAWKERYEAAREGELAGERGVADLKARLEEKERASALLMEQNRQLAARAPEALWEAFTKHVTNADEHWRIQEARLTDVLTKIDEIPGR
jgi:hypothetical protein